MTKTHGSIVRVVALISAVLWIAGAAAASATDSSLTLPDNSVVDLASKCPVCGMVVGGGLESSATYAYRHGKLAGFGGMAAAVFKDGHTVGFEGARCLFVYNTISKRFGINVGNIVRRYVTDFNTRKLIDANKAIFVMGSPVKGFMGFDLIPFSTREAAEKFVSEHGGKRVSEFNKIGGKDVRRDRGLSGEK